jgi:hypothetical protein
MSWAPQFNLPQIVRGSISPTIRRFYYREESIFNISKISKCRTEPCFQNLRGPTFSIPRFKAPLFDPHPRGKNFCKHLHNPKFHKHRDTTTKQRGTTNPQPPSSCPNPTPSQICRATGGPCKNLSPPGSSSSITRTSHSGFPALWAAFGRCRLRIGN